MASSERRCPSFARPGFPDTLQVFGIARRDCFNWSMDSQFFGRHFRSSNAVRYLLERDVTRIVRRAMIWFRINAEGRESAIVSRADALFVNIFGRSDQLIAYFLRRF